MAAPIDRERYARGRAALVASLVQSRQANLQPPPKLRLSEWAERYAVLSRETSAQTGRFRSFPYQVGIMDAVTDPSVTQVVVMKSARVGYTKILDHVLGYFVHQDPSPILVVQPRVEDAEDYSSTEVEPMLRDTPVLAAIVGDLKAKDGKQRLLKRVFRNGSSISFVGANSPGGFRRITSRVVVFDEVDGYPAGGAGNEGDQIALGIKRSETFWNRRIVLGSTPTVKGLSRIEKAWLESDQRRFYVPCPHCGEHQVLEWGGPDTPHGIKWDRDEAGNGDPATAHYVCINGCIIEDADKPDMVAGGEWRATAPFKGRAGFHIWAGYSLFPNASWSNLVAEWLRVMSDPLSRQTFINLVLGEPYEDRGDRALKEERLLERGEVWAAEVPDGVAVLTAGVDAQQDRLELELVGWGRNEESWSLAHEVFQGDPTEPSVWRDLDAYLQRIFRRADGRGFEIMATCIDSGGTATQQVYDFAKARLKRRVWAIKGASAVGGLRSPVWPTKSPSSRTKRAFKPIILGVNAAKDAIRARLHIEQAGPGYMHFPADRDLGWFSQLLSERSVVKLTGGHRYRVWELPAHRANEALDCRVYAYAALCGLTYQGLKLNMRADEIGASVTPFLRLVTGSPSAPAAPEPAPHREPTVSQAPPAERPMVTVQKKKTRVSRLA